MKLDLREYVTGDDLAEHFERFRFAYCYEESVDNYSNSGPMEAELSWFNENAPYFLPVLDKWVLNHVR